MSPKHKQGVVIALGLGKPPALDTPGKKPGGFGGVGPAPEHEAQETPEYESREESGSSVITEAMQPLIDAGASEEDAKGLLGDIFEAIARSLRGSEPTEKSFVPSAPESDQGNGQ